MRFASIALAALLTLGFGGAAMADDTETQTSEPAVVETAPASHDVEKSKETKTSTEKACKKKVKKAKK
ncbi:MAG: hypothetical protein K2W82_07770 [Candidatus Obscuribacterales bacterium]|nr:hypothetical protein [Candidatus Obscuribacterales bacterium]